ncbi:DedA family protein [Bifidobacterium mongoliense]|uniref:DedA family protein n=1 Tax=Bifidobacterium mongoliense TaxID=518643 RepID=UPI00264886AD|nr:DedA family protein [Bifidobacterium mongoliense]MDN6025023.1 DedA family protein [Bifidobacterium mongoliense]MDN6050870.1 DedA family protein [Bifidobacterium mongoliense]MDN6719767.1 DedA family protein [Bifidobacterium mongoliense]
MHVLILAASDVPGCTTSQSGIIDTVTDWLVMLMDRIGGIGVAIAIALESVFPPIPSEVILPLAGLSASRGAMPLFVAILCATIGSVSGAWLLYGLSRWIGLERILRAADVIPGVSRDDIDSADRWFTRFGSWSVLFGRIIPVVRSLISIPAGFNRMNPWIFTGWTILGSALWNTVLITAGYLLAERWCAVLDVLGVFENVVIAVVIVIVVFLLVRWVRNLLVKRESNGE